MVPFFVGPGLVHSGDKGLVGVEFVEDVLAGVLELVGVEGGGGGGWDRGSGDG